jgi:hypothetical protein
MTSFFHLAAVCCVPLQNENTERRLREREIFRAAVLGQLHAGASADADIQAKNSANGARFVPISRRPRTTTDL